MIKINNNNKTVAKSPVQAEGNSSQVPAEVTKTMGSIAHTFTSSSSLLNILLFNPHHTHACRSWHYYTHLTDEKMKL